MCEVEVSLQCWEEGQEGGERALHCSTTRNDDRQEKRLRKSASV